MSLDSHGVARLEAAVSAPRQILVRGLPVKFEVVQKHRHPAAIVHRKIDPRVECHRPLHARVQVHIHLVKIEDALGEGLAGERAVRSGWLGIRSEQQRQGHTRCQ